MFMFLVTYRIQFLKFSKLYMCFILQSSGWGSSWYAPRKPPENLYSDALLLSG